MSKYSIFPLFISLIIALALISCADNTEAELDDEKFGCEITYPYNNALINTSVGIIDIRVETHSDTSETLSTTLLINDKQKIVSTDSIVIYSWNINTQGAYTIKAITVNEAGEFAEDEVQVEINQ